LPKAQQAKAIKKVNGLKKNVKKIKRHPKLAKIILNKTEQEAKKVVKAVLPYCKVAEEKTTETHDKTEEKTDAGTQKKTTETDAETQTERRLSPAAKKADKTAVKNAPKALPIGKNGKPMLCRPRPTKA
jgi:hypothetical protein